VACQIIPTFVESLASADVGERRLMPKWAMLQPARISCGSRLAGFLVTGEQEPYVATVLVDFQLADVATLA